MRSKKCERCGFVSGGPVDHCKSCGALFADPGPGFQPAAFLQPSPQLADLPGSPTTEWSNTATAQPYAGRAPWDRKVLAMASLTSACASLGCSSFQTLYGWPAVAGAVVLLLTGIGVGIIALFKIKNDPRSYGGKRLAQAALAGNIILLLLYAVAVPGLVLGMLPKSNKPVWTKYSDGSYVIEMPGTLVEEEVNVAPESHAPIPFHNTLADLGRNGACIVGYGDYSNYKFTLPIDEVLDNAIKGANLKGDSTTISKKRISLNGNEGFEVELQPSVKKYGPNAFAMARVYWVPPRIYMNVIAGTKGGELYRDRVIFLDSFQLLNTPLIEAAAKGDVYGLKKLILASTDRKEKDLALVRAAKAGKVAAVKELLESGADFNAKDELDQKTALMWAMTSGDSDATRLLLDAGADLNVQDDKGDTVLVYAVRRGQKNWVATLLAAGAKVNTKNNEGETGWSIAVRLADLNPKSQEFAAILQSLKTAGAE